MSGLVLRSKLGWIFKMKTGKLYLIVSTILWKLFLAEVEMGLENCILLITQTLYGWIAIWYGFNEMALARLGWCSLRMECLGSHFRLPNSSDGVVFLSQAHTVLSRIPINRKLNKSTDFLENENAKSYYEYYKMLNWINEIVVPLLIFM